MRGKILRLFAKYRLPQWDDVQTYGDKRGVSTYSKIVQEVIVHIRMCEHECPQLLIQFNALNVLFAISSKYLVRAG